MSWQSKVLGLCKKYGSSAKFAATTILGAVVPGSPAVISLVEAAFDAAQKSGQDDWEINVGKQLQTTADNQARLEQMLDVLGGDLQHVFAQMASLQQMPQLADQMLAVAKANDARWEESAKKLDGIAHRFDRLERQGADILTVVEETRLLVRGLTTSDVTPEQDVSPYADGRTSFWPSSEEMAVIAQVCKANSATILDFGVGRKHAPDFTNRMLEPVAALVNLRELSLRGAIRLTDVIFDTIRHCRRLTQLTLSGTSITGHGLDALHELPDLRELSFTQCASLHPRYVHTLLRHPGLRSVILPKEQENSYFVKDTRRELYRLLEAAGKCELREF